MEQWRKQKAEIKRMVCDVFSFQSRGMNRDFACLNIQSGALDFRRRVDAMADRPARRVWLSLFTLYRVTKFVTY